MSVLFSRWMATNATKYALLGVLFGCLFPIIAIYLDLERLGLEYTLTNIIYIQSNFPIHLIIDTAPLIIGFLVGYAGYKNKISQEEIASENSFNNLSNSINEDSQLQLLLIFYRRSGIFGVAVMLMAVLLNASINSNDNILFPLFTGGNVILLITGFVLQLLFERAKRKPSLNLKKWRFFGILLITFTGLLWIPFCLLIFPELNDQTKLYIILSNAGIICGSTVVYPSFRLYSIIFISALTSSTFYNITSYDDSYTIEVAFMFCEFTIMMLAVLFGNYSVIMRSIQLKAEKIALTAENEISQRTTLVKEELLANMSHEIRTPMNGIIGMIDVLANSTKLDKTQQKYIETVQQSSHDLLKILNDILDLSKMEAGYMTLKKTEINIIEVVEKTIFLFKQNAKEKSIKLTLNQLNKLPNNVLLDEIKLTQVLSNLINNAIKFSNKNSLVKVQVSCNYNSDHTPQLKVEVIDTGKGIAQNDQKKLFQQFQQIDQSTTKQNKGTGLGLAICKKIISLFEGEIGVISDLKNGSTFWFTIPLEVRKQSSKVTKSNTINNDLFQLKLKILLVDDKDINITVASLMLNKLGCEVDTATNGQEAIDKYRDGKYDLILMDIQMPIMDGVEATRILKERNINLPPVIGVTAYAMSGDREKYINLGLDDYLPKPLTLEALSEKLREQFNL